MDENKGEIKEFTKLLQGSGIIFLGFILDRGFTFGGQVLLARILGRADFGAVSIGQTIAGTLGTLVLIGLNTGVGRYLPRANSSSKRRGVILSALHLIAPISLLVGGLIIYYARTIALVGFNNPSLTPLIQIFAIGIPLLAIKKFTIGVVQGREQSRPKVFIQNIIQPISKIILIGAALLIGFEEIGISISIVLAYGITTFVSIIYLVRYTPLLDDIVPDYIHRELIYFSAPLVVTSAMIIFLSDIDTLMIGYFSTTSDVGRYKVVYPIAQLLTLVFLSVKFVSMPLLSRIDSRGNRSRFQYIYSKATKWILVTTLPLYVLITVYSEWIIKSVYGTQYITGAAVLPILTSGFFVHAIAGPTEGTLTSLGRTRSIMAVSIITGVSNIVLNYILIQNFGIIGAAIATAISYAFMNLMYITILVVSEGISPFRRELFRVSAVGVVSLLAGFSMTQIELLPYQILPGLTFILVYIPGIILLCVSDEEIESVKNNTPSENVIADVFSRLFR
ncbi:flippase [Haloterrigena sp. H1]|uniref:flippase n=1 Tax=Haloterrigena sp. H1 TaxID=2552943 RepID=UPI00110D3073|nr:flippase [Haloterrigena sp. H1]TMT87011.1 flippase [Haloterrigena sp. H1]